MKKMCAALCVLVISAAAPGDVAMRQDFSLSYGWNAIYVEVSPEKGPDEVFASWPVKSVGFYDPAAFLATRQFSVDWDSQGVTINPVAMWHRDYPESSQVSHIPAGTVCLLFCTNTASAKTPVSLTGKPGAPRMTWHVTDTNDVFNFVGFSLQQGASVYPGDYLAGFDGEILRGAFYKFSGRNEDESPKITQVYSSTKVSDGDVLLAASSVQSDWSGALNVSPMGGLDFGQEGVQEMLSIRNDGTNECTVAIDIMDGIEDKEIVMRRSWLHLRDADVARTNATWTACVDGQTRLGEKRLAPGETWRLQVGLDRKALANQVAGLTFGQVLRITDVDGKSKMRVDVPLTGQTSGGYATARMWPGGLWVGDVALDSVKGPGDTIFTEAGGTLKLRLPLHVDAEGKVRLLQRVVSAGGVEPNGTYDYHLYAGKAAPSATENVVMRISAVCLPTETPVVEAETEGLASGAATFKFTVAAGGATSILRHPLHPQHDGLRWDFETPAPSGDVLQNYQYDVKPETFSVESRIDLSLDFAGGEAAWNPEESVSGTCTWSLTGLRHEGAITAKGPMTLRRVSPKTEIILE